MKIEVPCSFCGSLLRVDSVHAGKQLRCPTCSNLSQIPGQSADAADVSESDVSQTDQAANRYQAPPADAEQALPIYLNSNHGRPQENRGSSEGLIIGILGIVMSLGCSCLFPIWVILSLFGLYFSLKPNANFRTAAIITNLIALAISGLILLLALFS